MADQPEATQNAGNGTEQPVLNVLAQYIKDLSFENPNAPQSLQGLGKSPAININVNVNANPVGDTEFDVVLSINCRAEIEKKVLFNVELVYGGVFRMKNVPEQQMAPLLMIECPRMIFPFARQVLAAVTQQGGFPPLMMEPVDFTQIYRQNLANLAAQQQAGQNKAPGAAPAAVPGGTDKPN